MLALCEKLSPFQRALGQSITKPDTSNRLEQTLRRALGLILGFADQFEQSNAPWPPVKRKTGDNGVQEVTASVRGDDQR